MVTSQKQKRSRVAQKEQERVQQTLRFPKPLLGELSAHATARKESLHAFILRVLSTAMIEADPIDRKKTEKAWGGVQLGQIADKLGVTTRTAQNWAHDPSFPQPIGKEHKAFLYDEAEALAWVKKNRGLAPGMVAPKETLEEAKRRRAQAILDSFGTIDRDKLLKEVATQLTERLRVSLE